MAPPCPRCRATNATPLTSTKYKCNACGKRYFANLSVTASTAALPATHPAFRWPITRPSFVAATTLAKARKEQVEHVQKNIHNLTEQVATLRNVAATLDESNDLDSPIEALLDCVRKEETKLRDLMGSSSHSSEGTGSSSQQLPQQPQQPRPRRPRQPLTRMGLPNALPQVADHDLYTLILNFLFKSSPCQNTAQTLVQELQHHRLLQPAIAMPWDNNGNHNGTPTLAPTLPPLPGDHLRHLLSTSLTLLSCAESNHIQSSSLLDRRLPSSVRGMLVEAFMGGATPMYEHTQGIKTSLVDGRIALRQATHECDVAQQKYTAWQRGNDANNAPTHSVVIKRPDESSSFGIRLNSDDGRIFVDGVDRLSPTETGDRAEEEARRLLKTLLREDDDGDGGDGGDGGDNRCTVLRINGTVPQNVDHACRLMTERGRSSSTLEVRRERYDDVFCWNFSSFSCSPRFGAESLSFLLLLCLCVVFCCILWWWTGSVIWNGFGTTKPARTCGNDGRRRRNTTGIAWHWWRSVEML